MLFVHSTLTLFTLILVFLVYLIFVPQFPLASLSWVSFPFYLSFLYLLSPLHHHPQIHDEQMTIFLSDLLSSVHYHFICQQLS